MKFIKIACIALLSCTMLIGGTGCSSMTNTGKGALIGGGGGAAVGAGLGALIGGGKGAGIGSAIGAAVGAGAGALIGNKMDKQQKQLEEELSAIRPPSRKQPTGTVSRPSRLPSRVASSSPPAVYAQPSRQKPTLTRFAASLKENPDTNVQIYGYTDNTGSFEG